MFSPNKEQLQTAVLEALQSWSDLDGTDENLLAHLLLLHQSSRPVDRERPVALRLAMNQVLLEAIEKLKEQDLISAQVLSQRFIDKETVLMVAYRFGMSEDQIKRRQRLAVQRLAQIIEEKEAVLRREQAQSLQKQLPPAGYNRLFGMKAFQDELVQKVIADQAPWIVAVVGIGGIGKTALVDTAVRLVIEKFIFDDVFWLRADPTTYSSEEPNKLWPELLSQLTSHFCPDMPPTFSLPQQEAQLRQKLKTTQALIVIDNLEELEEVNHITQVLLNYANPSKFLLTSRVRLPTDVSAASLFLPELPPADCYELIRYQTQQLGIDDLQNAEDVVLQKIVQITGGNPLAIKLVVGLSTVLPLPEILTDLAEASTIEIEEMYHKIFWKAWRSLSENARLLLEMMPMTAGIGAQPEQLSAISGLDKGTLWQAITELVNCSLLEVRGTVWERRYGIHQLTAAFLKTEIIHWPEEKN